MIQRALLVLLIVINLGVAAWWATRAPPAPPPVAAQPAGVPRLQLLNEAPRRAAPRPAATVATGTPLIDSSAIAAPTATAAVATQCFSFGPYPNPAALHRTHARAREQVVRAQVREVAGTATGWRVFLPPLPSREEAQKTVDRMAAAGLEDLFVIPNGSEVNGIALGRYRREDAAKRRQAALQKAGFTVQLAPLGEAAMQGWIDVAAGADFDSARVAQDIAAAQVLKIDCATVK